MVKVVETSFNTQIPLPPIVKLLMVVVVGLGVLNVPPLIKTSSPDPGATLGLQLLPVLQALEVLPVQVLLGNLTP
jgi:hypothetical protein